MLVLQLQPAYKQNDPSSIVVVTHGGETLTITVLPAGDNKVRLGFDGSRSFGITRAAAIAKNPKPSSNR